MPKHRQPTPHHRRARPAAVAAGALVLVCSAAGAALAATAPDTTDSETSATALPTAAPTTQATTDSPTAEPTAEATTATPSTETATATSGVWLSGASGDGAADGTLGEWRGEPVQIVGTWADQGDNQIELYSIAPGGEVADWTGPIDIAPGGLQDGDTWTAAADGAYDDRWRQSLTRMAELRADDGTTYIRPFHEFNLGGAYPWAVTPDQADEFTAAWKRYRAIQQQVFPQAKLVYGVNVTSSGTDLDWRTTWPGAGEADVLGVDTYNGWPTITSTEQFDEQLDATGEDGIPVGLSAFAEQAKQWGVPLAVPEWSGRAEMGDEPAYVEGMTDWFAEHAGTGPGQLAYEVLFNAPQDDRNFQLYADDTKMPESAQAYVQSSGEAAAQERGLNSEPSDESTAGPSPSPAATATAATSLQDAEPTPAATASAPASTGAETDGVAASADVEALLARIDALMARLEQI